MPPSRNPKRREIERALEAAEHDLEVIGRATSMAQTEVGRYKAKNAERLLGELAKAKAGRAEDVSAHARPLLEAIRGFYQVDDVSKELRPYIQQVQETGLPGSDKPQKYTLTLGGAQTTQSVFGDRVAGLERGQLEGVIASLARLETMYAEASEAGQEAGGTDAA
jgi:hypothetical protein